jgi:EAL domain-containing protein (putative c-di-GMP-specific phosphodiesterase class I)
MLTDHIARTVAFEGLAPRRMVIEITATAARSGLGIGLGTLTRLRMKGFDLSIDDSSIGYSPKRLLSKISCSEVKIGETCIVKSRSDEFIRAMIESCQMLTRTQGLTLVAEGVVTRDEWGTVGVLASRWHAGIFCLPAPRCQCLRSLVARRART